MPNKLKSYLRNLAADGIALAFSGGTDSSLLLAVLAEMQQEKEFNFAVFTMRSALQDTSETESAKAFAAGYGITPNFFTFDPFAIDEVRHNRIDRCYHCKKAFFARFAKEAEQCGLKHLIDGTNADDLNVYRPGRRALEELGVISPLAEVGLTKADIRKLSAELGLRTADKPAVPCMATRFEYNTELSGEAMQKTAAAEAFIKKAFSHIRDVRLRVHGGLARLEVSKEHIGDIAAQHETVAAGLKNLGFDYVTLDLQGFRSGSFDIHLERK